MLLGDALRLQRSRIQRYPGTLAGIVVIAAVTFIFGNYHDEGKGHAALMQACGYLVSMWLCAVVIDMYACHKAFTGDFPVRHPRKELLYTLGCTAIGLLAISIRFMVPNWPGLPPLVRLAIAGGIVFFMYPIILVIISLISGYKPKELGFRLNGFVPALIAYGLTAFAAVLVAPHHFTWQMVLAESGGSIWGVLFTGFILAALPEEFFRMMWQSRCGAAFSNRAAGWLIASLLWGLMHVPHWYGQDKNLADALLSGIRIVPLGLMWGYLTHATKSILPAVLIHANNYWGLQNF